MDSSVISPTPRTCVLKVYLNCPACGKKVQRVLKKITGVSSISIDREHAKVTVSGAIDPDTLLRALAKNGKKAEVLSDSSSSLHMKNQTSNEKNCKTDAIGGQGKGRFQEDLDQLSEIKRSKQMDVTHSKTIKTNFIDDSNKRSLNFVADGFRREAVHEHLGGGCCSDRGDHHRFVTDDSHRQPEHQSLCGGLGSGATAQSCRNGQGRSHVNDYCDGRGHAQTEWDHEPAPILPPPSGCNCCPPDGALPPPPLAKPLPPVQAHSHRGAFRDESLYNCRLM